AGLATAALLAAAFGLAAAKLRTEWVRAPILASQTRSVDVYGYLELIEPRAGRDRQRLTLRVVAMERHEARTWPARVRVVARAPGTALEPGDAVRLEATL